MAQLAMAAAAKIGATLMASKTATVLSLASTGLQAYGQYRSGQVAEAQGEFLAKQYKQKATQDLATATHEAVARRRQQQILSSRALAVAAASGGSTVDPTVIKIMGDIEGQGDYNVRSALYRGESAYQTGMLEAETALLEGRQKKKAMGLSAAGTILAGASAFGNKLSKLADPYSAGDAAVRTSYKLAGTRVA